VRFREVTQATWPDMEKLFESKGCPSYCWCMAWRATPTEAKLPGQARKGALRKRVKAGVPIGLLGYEGQEPVAWCSIAPRETYRDLGGLKLEGEKEGQIWSLVCFFVKRDYRGQGLMPVLVKAAARHAKKHGAKVLEAYPVDPDSPSYRFMGFLPAFKKLGFKEMARAGSRRHVVRKRL